MKRLSLLQFLLIAGIAGMASAPQASMLRAMTLAELVTAADQIVVAKVVSVNAAWDSAHRKILSSIEVEVEESWKGSTSGFVTIVQPGGTVGEIEMTVHGMPKFEVGERSLLFLHGRARLQVVGMSQGKRRLSWDADARRWLVESPDVADVAEVGPSGRFRQARPAATVALDAFRNQVRTTNGQ
jgi:hypothetical protein